MQHTSTRRAAAPKGAKVVPLFPLSPEPHLDLRASVLRMGSEEYVVLSVPIEEPAERVALSPAEREVKAALLQGLSNRQIAEARGSAERTVANQVARIFRKHGVRSRKELLALELRGGSRRSGPGSGR